MISFIHLIEKIEHIDQQLFLFLNGINSPFFDPLMLFFTETYTWIPLYVILLYFIIRHYGPKSLFWILPLIALLITCSDQTSVHFFKNVFQRYRPCHNLNLQAQVHLIAGCGGKFGFVSSHAVNSFALATFFHFILKEKVKYFGVTIFVWAALVAYSRIYAGVHYPADIIFGALWGILIGFGFKSIFFFFISKFPKSIVPLSA